MNSKDSKKSKSKSKSDSKSKSESKAKSESKSKNIKDKEIGLCLSCIDYRLFDATVEFLKKDCCVDSFDHTILAGASLGFNQDEFCCWSVTFTKHVELAIELHKIKKLVVIDHEDCGAYRLLYPDLVCHPGREDKYHIKNIKEFISDMKTLFPDLIYSGYILRLDGTAQKVYQDAC